jgi:hypothetical protein
MRANDNMIGSPFSGKLQNLMCRRPALNFMSNAPFGKSLLYSLSSTLSHFLRIRDHMGGPLASVF